MTDQLDETAKTIKIELASPEWIAAFQWAWDRMEGWGTGEGEERKTFDFETRIQHAQILAANVLSWPRLEVQKSDDASDVREPTDSAE